MTPEQEQILAASSLFRAVPEPERERLRVLFELEQRQFGDLVIRQGDEADAFFILLSGRARVVKMTEGGQELTLNMLQPGDEFGEAALMSGGMRQASVRCSSAVTLARLSRNDFLALAQQFPEFKTFLELTIRWRALHGFLNEHSNFGRLPLQVLQALVGKLQPVEFPKEALIIREADPAGPMFIIQQGRVRIYSTTDGRETNKAFLREGDFFGELSILTNAPRAASAVAVTPCRLLALPPKTVRGMVEQFPEFNRLMEERRAQYKANREARVPLDFSTEALPAEAGLGQKTDLDPADEGESEAARDREEEHPFADRQGLFRKRKRRIRRIEFVQQIDEMDCGAASLAMVCRHFGRKVSLARIRQLCHTSSDGTSLKALSHAAAELGLASRALKVSLRNLPHMPLPAIVHWEGNHWMVLLDVAGKWVHVADPATGPRRIARAEFEQKWSGYAALFDYTIAFEQAPEARSTISWLFPFFSQFRVPLFQALILAVVASALQLMFPVFTQIVVDKAIVERDAGLLKMTVIGMGIAGFFMLASNLVQQYLLSRIYSFEVMVTDGKCPVEWVFYEKHPIRKRSPNGDRIH